MNKKKWLLFSTLLFILLVSTYGIYDFLDVDLDELPEGELLSEHPSPSGDYIARAFLIDQGGATVRTALRVEIDYGHKTKTIYWCYDENKVNLKWLGKNTIEINNHKLDIFKDTYNWKEDPDWENKRGEY
ncbi:hypothetical protein EYB33_12095 [Lysinibacillus sphaericus]|uniref:DUF5412 family protein n=1 Tax=Lysinibacillus TaxID=400634 RepID=UPI00084AACE0|nr:DUF5412 family protein [Lysinibacillus sphaericus]UDK97001.1 hypothetical protein EYB33_12095 [Lysinibacillus sphaericus]